MTLSPTWNVTCPPQQQQVSRKGVRTLSSPFSIQKVRGEGKETGLKLALFSPMRASLRHVAFGADFQRDQLLRSKRQHRNHLRPYARAGQAAPYRASARSAISLMS